MSTEREHKNLIDAMGRAQAKGLGLGRALSAVVEVWLPDWSFDAYGLPDSRLSDSYLSAKVRRRVAGDALGTGRGDRGAPEGER